MAGGGAGEGGGGRDSGGSREAGGCLDPGVGVGVVSVHGGMRKDRTHPGLSTGVTPLALALSQISLLTCVYPVLLGLRILFVRLLSRHGIALCVRISAFFRRCVLAFPEEGGGGGGGGKNELQCPIAIAGALIYR